MPAVQNLPSPMNNAAVNNFVVVPPRSPGNDKIQYCRFEATGCRSGNNCRFPHRGLQGYSNTGVTGLFNSFSDLCFLLNY